MVMPTRKPLDVISILLGSIHSKLYMLHAWVLCRYAWEMDREGLCNIVFVCGRTDSRCWGADLIFRVAGRVN